MINQDISEPLSWRWRQVIAREDARDGTLRPRLMIGRYSRCTAWYGTPLHGPLHAAKHDQTSLKLVSFSPVKTRIRVFSPTSFIREKGSSDKALRVSSLDYDVARVYMNILVSNSKRVNIRVFLSFFLSLLASFLYFFISDSKRLDRSVVPYSRSLIQRDQDSGKYKMF
jgi:hypothetical protein